MKNSLLVSCFDVDYSLNPKKKLACSLDHVSVTCVGRLFVLKLGISEFLLSLCASGHDSDTLAFARINYSGIYKKRGELLTRIKASSGVTQLACGSNEYQVDAFFTRDRICATNLIAEYWCCYGGNWIIAVNCSNLDAFHANCACAELGIINASEARDRLVGVSDIAAVTFDDNMIDILTAKYDAQTMRERLIKQSIQCAYSIEWVPDQTPPSD